MFRNKSLLYVAQLGDNDVPSSGAEVSRVIFDTVAHVWSSFVSHSPYLFAGIVIVLATSLLALAARKIVFTLTSKSRMRDSLRDVIARLLTISIWVLGLLTAAVVMFLGLSPTKAIGGLGLLSVAVGFAFKDIFENFFAGILLLWRFPFEAGDYIECEGIEGKVERINLRMSEIRKTNGELVVVPNAFLFTNPVDVLTDKPHRRITITAGVSYDTSLDEALPIIKEAVASCETVSSEKPVEIFPEGFGSSSIDIEVAWWAAPTSLDYRKSRGEVIKAIKAALDEAGIEIPFPYRTLTFKEPLPINQD